MQHAAAASPATSTTSPAAVVFLASPTCRGFVTGTTIHVDGGNLAAGGWHRQPTAATRPRRRPVSTT